MLVEDGSSLAVPAAKPCKGLELVCSQRCEQPLQQLRPSTLMGQEAVQEPCKQ